MSRRNRRDRGKPQMSKALRDKQPGGYVRLPPTYPSAPARPATRPVEDVVVPAGRCTHPRGKDRYRDEAHAAEALKAARTNRLRTNAAPSVIEVRYYECDWNGCGGWHLTSQPERRRP